MNEKSKIDQQGQTVQGPQTNIGGDARTVLSGEFHGPVIVDSSGASVPLPIPHQIPLPPLDFTGRDEELQELQSSCERGAVAIGLRGMGGVGKSALAFALADRLRDRFPDGQLFVKMMGTSAKPLQPEEAMTQVIRSMLRSFACPRARQRWPISTAPSSMANALFFCSITPWMTVR